VEIDGKETRVHWEQPAGFSHEASERTLSELPDIDGLWDYHDPAGSERRFRELLPRARDDASASYLAELMTQIARAICLQRAYERAHCVLDEARAFVDASARAKIRYLLERGRIHNDTGRTTDALEHFRDAWRLAEQADEHVLAADALHMIAYVTDGEESLQWHEIAIDFCKSRTEERFERWLCTLHMNAADKCSKLGAYDRAIENAGNCLDVATRLQWTERILDAKCLLAKLRRKSGDLDLACALLDEVLAADESHGYAYEEHAECLLQLGRTPEARHAFARAYALLSGDPWFPPTETARLERIRKLAADES